MRQEWDALLVLRCQEGNADAFAQLVARWHGRLRAHARRLTGDDHAADDVLQETWASVVSGIRSLEDVDAFPKWVFRITTNKCRDWVRRRQRRRWFQAVFMRERRRAEEPQRPAAGGVEELHAALQRLSPIHAAAVTLHYYEGFSIHEIAQMLSIPPGTVKSRLSEARRNIRAYLEATKNE